jgi:hypothetical protein
LSGERGTGRGRKANRKICLVRRRIPTTHHREFQMSFSVTENVSAVTDVQSLLSHLGFDPGNDTPLELVIDQFEQWRTTTRGAYVPSCVVTRMEMAA